MNNQDVEKEVKNYLTEVFKTQKISEGQHPYVNAHYHRLDGGLVLYLYLDRPSRYLARISKNTVRVRKGSRYLGILAKYAKANGRRLIEVDIIIPPDTLQSLYPLGFDLKNWVIE